MTFQRLSSKYDAPEERLPASDIAAMQELRGHNRALKSMRYYAMAKFDLEMHGGPVGGTGNSGGYDAIQANYDATMLEVGLVHPVDGGHYITSWYHPVQGYDAGYYGYGWSESIAHDFKGAFEAMVLWHSKNTKRTVWMVNTLTH